jgi:S1-C subfamily serine protease
LHGEPVVALGYPVGFDSLIATSGLISGLLTIPSERVPLFSMKTFLTDALINHGSSGGPLILESTGMAIGIVTMAHVVKNRDVLTEYLKSDSLPESTRGLINYILKYLHIGYSYAISVSYAIDGDNLKK